MNKENPGVFEAKKKNGEIYYRSSLTYKGKHISLGSFDNKTDAGYAYLEGNELLKDKSITVNKVIDFIDYYHLSFEKCVSIINFRDNGIYFANPIYIEKKYFYYYLNTEDIYKFDADDLFFYASHKLMKRGNHLFVSSFGNQENILSRYGIRPHSVQDRDYRFKNDDKYDLRYSNVEVLNPYYGVERAGVKGKKKYKAVINIKGKFVIGYYETMEIAAVAYNKAVNCLKNKNVTSDYPLNTGLPFDKEEYIKIYESIRISEKITKFQND